MTRWPRTQSKHERAGTGQARVGVGGGGNEKGPYLHHAADDLGQHVQREPENVEERERHEGLLSVQDVVLIHRHVHGESRQRHLNRQIWAGDFIGETHLEKGENATSS